MINAAVVGYGYAGRSFHSYLISLAEGINLYAISTRDPGRQAAARAAHPEAKICGSLGEVLEDDLVDLVVVATPHNTHRGLSIQAMDAGKHVITDKIMAMTLAGDAILANPPPLILDSCLRIALTSLIGAPLPNNWWLISSRSLRSIPASGSSNNAEPPPEIKTITVSSSFTSSRTDWTLFPA